MPQKIKDATGKETEMFTQEEMDEKSKTDVEKATTETKESASKEAIEQYKKENPDKTEEMKGLQEKLDEATGKLKDIEDGKGEGGPDEQQQKDRLKKTADDAKKALDDHKDETTKQIKDLTETIIGDTKKDYLDKLSKGDKELREKIEVEFNKYDPEKTSKADIGERMEKAYTLAAGEKPAPSLLDNVTQNPSGDGTNPVGDDKTKKEPTENEKKMGEQFGISDEDRKKYGPDFDPKKINQ